MRSALYVSMLAMCLIALQCTADGAGEEELQAPLEHDPPLPAISATEAPTVVDSNPNKGANTGPGPSVDQPPAARSDANNAPAAAPDHSTGGDDLDVFVPPTGPAPAAPAAPSVRDGGSGGTPSSSGPPPPPPPPRSGGSSSTGGALGSSSSSGTASRGGGGGGGGSDKSPSSSSLPSPPSSGSGSSTRSGNTGSGNTGSSTSGSGSAGSTMNSTTTTQMIDDIEPEKQVTETSTAPITPLITSNKSAQQLNSVEKKNDGSNSTSLVLAFAALFTIAVVYVAPVY